MNIILRNAVLSYLSIVVYLNALYIPSYQWFLNRGRYIWEVSPDYGHIGYIIIPPMIGSFVYICLSGMVKKSYFFTFLFILYYLIFYPVTLLIAGHVTVTTLKIEAVSSTDIFSTIA